MNHISSKTQAWMFYEVIHCAGRALVNTRPNQLYWCDWEMGNSHPMQSSGLPHANQQCLPLLLSSPGEQSREKWLKGDTKCSDHVIFNQSYCSYEITWVTTTIMWSSTNHIAHMSHNYHHKFLCPRVINLVTGVFSKIGVSTPTMLHTAYHQPRLSSWTFWAYGTNDALQWWHERTGWRSEMSNYIFKHTAMYMEKWPQVRTHTEQKS